MAEEYAVEVENISKIYTLRNKNNQYKTDKKEFYALKGVTFKVKKGDVLVTFDIESLKKEGYSLVTPIIVTNTADYLDVVEVANGSVKLGDDLLTLLN